MKGTKKGITATGLIVGLVLASNSHAIGKGDRLFNKLDADSNGVIELAEVHQNKESQFAKIDRNSNGYLEAEELEAKRARVQQRLADMDIFANLDKNDDGVVSLDEYLQSTSIIDLADGDDSGDVDKDEFIAFVKARKN